MSSVEVVAVVGSIVAAFGSGLDVFRRMLTKQTAKKQKKRDARLTHEELQLQDSLCRGSRTIKAEYDRNVTKLGPRFEVGDATAHSALAHTLLMLNTGLIDIINHALSGDPKARLMSKKSLLSLSENAAADTLNALTQLNRRLTPVAAPGSRPQAHPSTKHGMKSKTLKQEPAVATVTKPVLAQWKERARPGPDPLARGGWIRSKSGTSVVSVASSTFRSPKHKSSISTPSPITTTCVKPPEMRAANLSSTPEGNRPCACQTNALNPRYDDEMHGHQQYIEQRQQLQGLDLILASPDVFSTHTPPPRPPKIPIHRAMSSRKPRPPSVATFLTASTKIGEIPEHRWLDRPALPWDNRPLPYVIPPPLEPHPVKKKGIGFKSWWKNCNTD